MRKTSNQDFKEFVAEAKRIVALLGLTDWRIFFQHIHLKERAAHCVYQVSSRHATIALSTELNDLENYNMKTLAIHETTHLLLADFYHLAVSRMGVSEEDFDRAEHAIVRRLEDIL